MSDAQTRNFAFTIIDVEGKKKLAFDAPTYYQTFINKLKLGQKGSIAVDLNKSKRSDRQNRFYWVYLTQIADETGEDIEALHALFKGKFLSRGVREILGERVRIVKSTTDFTVGEFSEYIMQIHQMTEVEPPDPRNYDIAPLR